MLHFQRVISNLTRNKQCTKHNVEPLQMKIAGNKPSK